MQTRKPLLILLLAASLALALVGCDSKTNLVPVITRMQASPECGIAPMHVQFVAIASGGDRLDNPTGGNDYLDVVWDFGDGNSGNGSITTHRFTEDGTFEVVVTVSDKDGDKATSTLTVEMLPDSLSITTPADTTVAAGWEYFAVPTPRDTNAVAMGATKSGVVINEVLIFNESVATDLGGNFRPYIEVINMTDENVDLQNYALSMSLDDPRDHVFGSGTIIEPGEHQMIWLEADGDGVDGAEPRAGITALFGPNNEYTTPETWPGGTFYLMAPGNTPLDAAVLGPQQTDVSYGLVYDAAAQGMVELNTWIETCGFDPVVGNYDRFDFTWTIDDALGTTYPGRTPTHTFSTDDIGTRSIDLLVFDIQNSVYRHATVTVEVTAP